MTVVTNSNTAVSNTATPAGAAQSGAVPRQATAGPDSSGTVETALAAAIKDATRIGDLLDTLRTARLWLPLPDDGTTATDGAAVNLPTVTYLGSEFVPAYTSAELLSLLVGKHDPSGVVSDVPHVVVRATDLARLMPPDVGIALNAGARQSVPVYPQGVAFLAADQPTDERRITVGPLPAEPAHLLAAIRAGLADIPQAVQASAGWLSVQFAGEGLVVSVTLDDPADESAQEAVIGALEHAADVAQDDASFSIDVTFPGDGEPDHIDHWIATAATPFYVRGGE